MPKQKIPMPRLPVFWLGSLTAICLLGAWLDSGWHGRIWTQRLGPDSRFEVYSAGGAFGFRHVREFRGPSSMPRLYTSLMSGGLRFPLPGFIRGAKAVEHVTPAPAPAGVPPTPHSSHIIEETSGLWIPYWLVFAVLAAVWWFVCRQQALRLKALARPD